MHVHGVGLEASVTGQFDGRFHKRSCGDRREIRFGGKRGISDVANAYLGLDPSSQQYPHAIMNSQMNNCRMHKCYVIRQLPPTML